MGGGAVEGLCRHQQWYHLGRHLGEIVLLGGFAWKITHE